jgi:hypothetical protein
MSKLMSLGFALSLFFPTNALAQDPDPETVKKTILEKVREKLAKERKKILKQVAEIIERELKRDGKKTEAKPKPDKPEISPELAKAIKKLEREERMLEEKREEVRTRIQKLKRLAADEPIRKEAKENGPADGQEAQELFDEALRAHEEADYKTSIHKFKILAYKFSGTQFAHISAYNVACGYALSGKKQHALDWLEISVKGGYDDFEHMRADSDLDSLRKEKRYNKLLLDN